MGWARFYGEAEDVFPRFAERADGYELTASDGRSFVDWVGAGGPVVLGYGHPAVEEAMHDPELLKRFSLLGVEAAGAAQASA